MPQLLTATLDDVNRKRGDLYPITATLRANGVAANLTGASVAITIVDSLTRAPVVIGGSCTIPDAVNGKVSYQPLAADVDREGTFDVEFKEILAGSPSHFPCADYASLRLWPTLDLPPFVPPVAGINDHSITLAMLAQQTPGAVLIYDASGNAAVLADVAAGKVLTSTGAGVPPSYQDPAVVKLIDQAFTGVALQTISFAANRYRRIAVNLFMSAGTFSNVALTGLAAASYAMQYVFNVGAGAPTTASTSGANNWAAGNVSPLDAFIDIAMPPAPAQKGAKIDLAATGGIGQFAAGRSTDTTNDPTAVVVNMTAGSAGYITAWGYP